MNTARERLKAWRIERMMSQGAAADKLGIGQASLSKLETGARRPLLDTALIIEKVTSGFVPAALWRKSK